MYIFNICFGGGFSKCVILGGTYAISMAYIFDHFMTEEKNTLVLMLNLSLSQGPVRILKLLLELKTKVIKGNWLQMMTKLMGPM